MRRADEGSLVVGGVCPVKLFHYLPHPPQHLLPAGNTCPVESRHTKLTKWWSKLPYFPEERPEPLFSSSLFSTQPLNDAGLCTGLTSIYTRSPHSGFLRVLFRAVHSSKLESDTLTPHPTPLTPHSSPPTPHPSLCTTHLVFPHTSAAATLSESPVVSTL